MHECNGTRAWQTVWSRRGTKVGGAPYGSLIVSLRRFLAAFAAARPDADMVAGLRRLLDQWSSSLESVAVAESDQVYAQRPDLEGRGQVTSPAIRFESLGEADMKGCVTFDRYFLGSNGAAHGGAVAFMFDEAAGRLAHLGGRPTARTAYLRTTFLSITPIDVPLAISGRILREEGRKRFMHLDLFSGDTRCAECEVLMVELKPGQA
jgi:acyl-coenzyme A thioesterase PaaI-like protein